MKIRFYIEKRKGEDGRLLTKERPVFMTVAFHGKRVLISSGKKIDMDWWDAERQRVREEHPESLVLNSWFENMQQTAQSAWKAISNTETADSCGGDEEVFLKQVQGNGDFDPLGLEA